MENNDRIDYVCKCDNKHHYWVWWLILVIIVSALTSVAVHYYEHP